VSLEDREGGETAEIDFTKCLVPPLTLKIHTFGRAGTDRYFSYGEHDFVPNLWLTWFISESIISASRSLFLGTELLNL